MSKDPTVITQAKANGSGVTTFPNSLAGLKTGLDALKDWLTSANVGQQAEDRAFLVFEEIVTNIIRYAFDDAREHPITVSFARSDSELTLVFEDDGQAFDPRKVPAPDLHRPLAAAPIGGRGIYLVRKSSKRIDYERIAKGRNRLTVVVALT
jgi:anti-sigma regulatory factor (Ser/Thr protein kinase)